MESYILKRSNRKTITLSVDKDLNVIVKAPNKVSKKYINDFVQKNSNWIEKAKNETKEYYENK